MCCAPVPMVLIVDDNAVLRDAIQMVLEDEGYTAQHAADGAAALAVLRAGPAGVCLVVLDLMMPVMDGWQFRRAQLADPVLATIPVIVVSAGSDIVRHGLPAGITPGAFLPKPFTIDALLGLVTRYCGPSPP